MKFALPMHKYEPICLRSSRDSRSTDPLYESTVREKKVKTQSTINVN